MTFPKCFRNKYITPNLDPYSVCLDCGFKLACTTAILDEPHFEYTPASDCETLLNDLIECYEQLGNLYHWKGDRKKSEIFYGVMVLLKQQKFDKTVIKKETEEAKKQIKIEELRCKRGEQ